MEQEGWRTPKGRSIPPVPNRGRGWPALRGYPRGRGRGQSGRGRGEIPPPKMIPLKTYLYGSHDPPQADQQQPPENMQEKIANQTSDMFEPILKISVEHLLYLNLEDKDIISPWILFKKYLNDNPILQDSNYDRESYEAILIHLQCLEVKHHYDDKRNIIYSRANLLTIIHPKDWGITPFQIQKFNIQNSDGTFKTCSFNYWTYVQAMHKAFYILNPTHSHSWMFIINPEILENLIPLWFYKWWETKGAIISILPPELQLSYNHWVDSSPHLQNIKTEDFIDGMGEFIFFAQAQIPWIWSWNIEINTDSLNLKNLMRNFSIKWWSAIIVEDKKKQIDKVIQNNLIRNQRQPVSTEFSLKNLQKILKQKYPHETSDQIKTRLQKAYWDQMTQLFPDDEDMTSQHSNDTIPDTWDKHEEEGPSRSPGKAPINEEQDNF
ncbi:hypothetical protein KFK09_022279 [Dendrobium nobile]|uniref:Uncharacterized protein n=1 Tax=Dendrobium nobile TaxID=94219 RepID=A0A8T3AJM0_DENNO|nr:hypothetical protein KFK09_022279 [Dendrobium nobile]